MLHMKANNLLYYFLLLLCMGFIVSCSDDEEPMEMEGEEEEEINQVMLTFTPDGGGDAVVATWFDPDGEGSGAPMIDAINLAEGVSYTLGLTLTNTLGSTPEDITAEILEEADEHQLFFSFTNGIFSDPTGDGNVDNASDPINYNDQDGGGLPLGLSTSWTAGGHTDSPGSFNILLKHQPGAKTASSDSNTGSTDIDITLPLNILEGEGEEEEEEINEIILTFTPTAGGSAISASFVDPDGEGAGAPVIEDIILAANTEYDLTVALLNTLGTDPEDITEEIMEEDDEHMFFFGFTDGIFSNPTGDGNVDSRQDPLNYNDQDDNGLPVGLSTRWTTGAAASGEFNIVLKHQPGQKTDTSDATVGGTDVDVSFSLSIQ